MHEYIKHTINNFVSIRSFQSIYYFELTGINPGVKEYHDFPEIVYVAKGTHELYINDAPYSLVEGQMVIYAPNAIHYSLYQNSQIAIVSFELESDSIASIYNKIITLTLPQRESLMKIISLGIEVFTPQTPNGHTISMVLKDRTPASQLQTIKNLTELFLIDVYESNSKETSTSSTADSGGRKISLFSAIVDYMKANVNTDFSLSQISTEFKISISTLKNLFKSHYNSSPKAYFINLKIEEAKRMIRETSLSFTEISSHLNFSSVHYFSKLFKDKLGVTPSEYAKLCRKK